MRDVIKAWHVWLKASGGRVFLVLAVSKSERGAVRMAKQHLVARGAISLGGARVQDVKPLSHSQAGTVNEWQAKADAGEGR